MRKLFIALGISLAFATFVRAQSYDWAISSLGSPAAADEGKSVCMDAEGNSYVTGSFSSASFALGKFSLMNSSANPSSPMNSDMFVAKLDPTGKVLWAMQSKGSGEERGIDIACDKTGHVVVVGIFKGASATFGTTELKNPGVNSFSAFIMRINALGNILWVQRAGGKSDTRVESVSTGPQGEVYITGSFAYGVTFGGYEYKSKSGNNSSVFVAKYLSNGELKWFEQIYGQRPGGQNSTQVGKAIFATSDGRFVYAAGWFRGRVTFGNEEIVSNSEPSPMGQHLNIFITKYDAEGRGIWTSSVGAKQVNFGPEPEITDIAVDGQGSSYLTGYFAGVLLFGTEEMKGVSSKSRTWNRDIFLAKYDGDGKHLWHRSAGGSENDESQSIALTSSGVVITGAVTGRDVRFGDVSLLGGFSNLFTAGYDADGKALWAIGAKAVVASKGNGIATNATHTIVTGQYLANGITLGNIRLKGISSGNAFFAKLK